MSANNAIQQVFNPAMQRTLLRIGLFTALGLVLVLAVGFGIRFFKKTSSPGSPNNSGGNTGSGAQGPVGPDGTPGNGAMPQNLKRLGDSLKQSSGWSWPCNDVRCDTLLAMAELPDAQLERLAEYYRSMYGNTLQETFNEFYVSGCCFKEAGAVVDAKLKSIQDRVKQLNI